MKHMGLLGVLLLAGALGAWAAPWAETRGSEFARQFPQEVTAHNLQRKNFTLLPQILAGEPVRVRIQVPGATQEDDYKQAQQDIQYAYNDWFANAASWIREQKRTQEFADVLPLLKQPVRLEFVSSDTRVPEGIAPVDVELLLFDTVGEVRVACACTQCNGCRCPGQGDEATRIITQRYDYQGLLHEVGHTLGLADAYPEGYDRNASPNYRSQERRDLSVMGIELTLLTEDDADGLINLVDAWTVSQAQQTYPQDWRAHLSERVLNGWDSFVLDVNQIPQDRYQLGTSQTVWEE